MNVNAASLSRVVNQWDPVKAATLKGNEISLLIYRSNLLGSDLRVTNYGGGNTSCKTLEEDPLSGESVEVLWVKGSGGDIGTLTRGGLAALFNGRLHNLKKRYRGLSNEDEMVDLFNHCIFDLNSKAPSIDTPLHAFLPFKHIDHLHPDAIIAIAASKEGEKITDKLFNGKVAWIPWQRPGFDLALKLESCIKENKGLEGIILGGHGLFTWGDTSEACYGNSLDKINTACEFLEQQYEAKGPSFGGSALSSLQKEKRLSQAASMAPILRGLCSLQKQMVGHFTDDERVLEFINSQHINRLAAMGTSCPDHFLRTKIRPLVLSLKSDVEVNADALRPELEKAFDTYRASYKQYYEKHKHPDSPAMRDANPVIILWPGVGMFSFARNKQTARVAAEFYINAINVMKGAEAVSEYVALPLQEAFNIEYWLLEEAKLKRMPPEKPLAGRVALITGGSGGIGKAIVLKLMKEGAAVFATDIDEKALAEFVKANDSDTLQGSVLNVTDKDSIANALQYVNLAYGGVDIIVNCAGLAISKSIQETTSQDWRILQNVIVEGQFNVTQQALITMRAQAFGGDIVNIASKNGLVAGPNNLGYGTAKAAQIHMSRLLAAELGHNKIRVNVVNPDAVITGSKIWEGEWANGRAKAYGIKPDELPSHYAKRTLLNEIIEVDDIANAVFAFTSGLLSKSTGNIINVDGGMPAAFTR
jgi:rhamnulose-1-phosphate aldolase/alcohol dehydrogenase